MLLCSSLFSSWALFADTLCELKTYWYSHVDPKATDIKQVTNTVIKWTRPKVRTAKTNENLIWSAGKGASIDCLCSSMPEEALCGVFKSPGSEVKPVCVRGHSFSQHSGSKAYFRHPEAPLEDVSRIKENNAGKQLSALSAPHCSMKPKMKAQALEFWDFFYGSVQCRRTSTNLVFSFGSSVYSMLLLTYDWAPISV